MKIRIYFDLLQYTSEEQKQINKHNKGNGSSSQIIQRNIDAPDIGDRYSRWYTDVIISRSNQYEMLEYQQIQDDKVKEITMSSNPIGCSVSDVIKLFKSNKAIKEQLQQINFNINSYNNR